MEPSPAAPDAPVRSAVGTRWVATAALAGALVTTATVWLGEGVSARAGARAALVAAGLGLAFGALVGGLEWLVVRVGRRPLAALDSRLRPHVDRAADAPRQPVLALHGLVISSLLGLGLLAAAGKLAMMRLRTVQNLELQEALTIVSMLGASALAIALAVATRSLLLRVLARIDARVRLPLPPQPALRTILWLALPLMAVGAAGVVLLGKALGPFVAPFVLLAVLGLQAAVGALIGRLARAATATGPRPLVVGLLVATVGLAAAHVAATRMDGAAATLDRSPWPAALARGVRAASDVDGDGVSSLFGGKDCAPLASSRRPGANDVPGNGVDEDCNGSDAESNLAIPKGPRFASGVQGKRRDVVWFVVDALRADHTSLLGHKRVTTPNIDRLAKESLVFKNALSQSSATMLSFPSFFTGLDPGRLTWRIEKERLQLGRGQPTIAERLGGMGYQTGFAAGGYFKIRLPGLTEGWSWVGYSERKQTVSSASAASLAAQFITRSQENRAPFFLVVYLPAPHAPYVGHGAGYPDWGKKPIDLYDEEIVNADRYIGFVLDLLRADEKRWDDTVVVVTGDHGEEFGEHGGSEHASNCHIESLHVPLVLRAPGIKAAKIDRRVGLIDLVPTMLDLVGGTAAEDELDGHSLLVTANDPELLPEDRPHFCSVVSQKATQGNFFRRAVRSGRWLAMKDLRSGQGISLYDTEADRGEQTPVALEGEAGEAGKRLEAWLDLQLTSNLGEIPLGEDPEN